MKFGILTFFDVINYGAVLQAYALQNKINSYGNQSEFIRILDDHNHTKTTNKFKLYLNILRNNQFNLKTYILTRNVEHQKKDLFLEFRERYLSQSRLSYRKMEDLERDEGLYDGFVTGSDMVWSDIGQNLDIYFLTFTQNNKRLSYAPSLTGRDEETDISRQKYKNWLEGISSLSCREKYGVKYIQNLTGRLPKHVVDPTLLLEKNEWVEAFDLKGSQSDKYILCYLFRGITPKIEKKVKLYAKKYNLDIKYIPMSSKEVRYNQQNGHNNFIGPKEFVELFYNAEYVFTNSFHGLLFSLIMNKSFSLLHRGKTNEWLKHEERMSSILEILNLSDRFIYEDDMKNDLNFDIDYYSVNIIIKNLRKDSLDYLKNALDSVNNQEKKEKKIYQRIDELESNKCTGCTACLNICPTNAIKMEPSDEGFLFPIINECKCINCKKCSNVCAAINSVTLNYPQKTFCGVGNNKLVKESASGGAFVTFAKYIIEELKGVVFGASLIMPQGKCCHIAVDTINELYKLQNSKYVQSDITNVLSECKEKLHLGKTVLFSGTPCQIASLKNYLGEDYNNLYTMDIICHGVPSPKFLQEYIKNEIPSNVSDFKFRHKLNTEIRRSAFDINYTIDRKIVVKYGVNDIYYASFIKGESYRECCYSCEYAREERCSDITIGDCDSWRLHTGIEKNNILSSIIINTHKGELLWDRCKELFLYEHMNYREECIINHQLRRPSARPERRNTIYKDLGKSWKSFKSQSRVKKKGFSIMIKRIILKMMG